MRGNLFDMSVIAPVCLGQIAVSSQLYLGFAAVVHHSEEPTVLYALITLSIWAHAVLAATRARGNRPQVNIEQTRRFSLCALPC